MLPETDEGGAFAWRTRTRIDRLSHGEIRAWLDLNDLSLEAWEMAALSLLDEAYVQAFNAASASPQQLVSERPLSSSLFKALFGKK